MTEREPLDEEVAALEARRAAHGRAGGRAAGGGGRGPDRHRRRAGRSSWRPGRRRSTASRPAVLSSYERLRTRLDGVGAARLVNGRCDGCHLSLSRTELAVAPREPPDALLHCEQCGRILVRVILWPAGLALVAGVDDLPRPGPRLPPGGRRRPPARPDRRPLRRARVMHTVVASVVLLVGVMLATTPSAPGPPPAAGRPHRHVPPPRPRRHVDPHRDLLVALPRPHASTAACPRSTARSPCWSSRSWPAPPPWPGCGGSGTWQTRRSGATCSAPAAFPGSPRPSERLPA